MNFSKIKYQVVKLYWKFFKPINLGARVLLVNKNRVLLLEHHYVPKYYLPGGQIRRDETFEEAAKREVLEETGIKIDNLKLLGIYQSSWEGKRSVQVIFTANTNVLEIKIHDPKEIKNMGWFDLNDLPSDVSEGTQRRIEEFKKNHLGNFGKW